MMVANPHPNAHPSAGAYTNAAQIAASMMLVKARTAVKAVRLVRHHAMLLETRVKAHASGRPGPKAPTGDYRRSWTHELSSGPTKVVGRVGTNRPQSRRLEYGFVGADRLGRIYNQEPYPHLGPAVDQTGPGFEDAVGELGGWED